jgi:exonuclease SbcC
MVTDSPQVGLIEQVLERRLALRELLQGAQKVIRNAAVLTRYGQAVEPRQPSREAKAGSEVAVHCSPRFTVSIQTLLETAKGDQREGFDIRVYDAESAESKSLTCMSAGERTIIESCLTRAIALYLAHSSGRKYMTLFSDEADGALDPDRKRMFMAMKRQVLRLGGYEREFFISQTPELAAMADAVIDLETFVVGEACEIDAVGPTDMEGAAP